MSETTPETQPVTTPAVAEPAPVQQNEADLPQWARDAITKANKEAASYRTQVAELKPQADQFKVLEEASKTEAQRLADAATAAQKEATDARADAVRYKVAATHGIPAEHFDLLGTGSEEEVTARGEKLAQILAAQAAVAAPTVGAPATRPVAQLRPGATPAESKTEDDLVMERLFGAPK